MDFQDLTAPMIRLDPPKPIEELRKPKGVNVMKPSISAAAVSSYKFHSTNNKRTSPSHSFHSADGHKSNNTNHITAGDVVAAIFPPKEVQLHADGRMMYQTVSMQPATRLDVIKLQETLDNRLVQRQAITTGICDIRLQLFNDAFDELIRQITIDCPERGLLLLRIRDEARQSIHFHRLLCDTGKAFVVKNVVSESELEELRRTIGNIEREKAELQAQVCELKDRIVKMEKTSFEARLSDEQEYERQAEFLRKTIQQLNIHIKAETEKNNMRSK